MSLIRWSPLFSMDPFEDREKFFEGFPSTAHRGLQGFLPAADLYQTKDAVIVELPLAGADPEKVDISIKDDVLHVKGTTEKKIEVEDRQYMHREIRRGSFERSIPLPAHVQGDRASAISENGLLKISVPKVEPAKSEKKIKVRVEKKEEK